MLLLRENLAEIGLHYMGGKVRKYLTYDSEVIPMDFPRMLVETAVDQHANRDELLKDTNISPAMLESPDARISLCQYERLIDNAIRLTRNPTLSLDFGRRVKLSNLGILSLATMSSPDVRTALNLALEYYRVKVPAWDLSLRVNGDIASLTARETIPLGAKRVFVSELMLIGLSTLAQSLLNREVPILEIKVDYPRPAHAERYREFTSAPILFDQPKKEVLFEASFLEEKLPLSDPITLRAVERQCAVELTSVVSPEGLINKILRILSATPGEYPSLQELARMMHMSERSLQCDLNDMDTSYQKLLDKARCEQAKECLVGTTMSVNEIADHLGFSEGRSFRRAFKRWTGQTPSQYRSAK